MHARTAQPFFLSVLLHGAAVGLIVWIAWRIAASPVPPVHVFDVPPGDFGSFSSSGNAPVTASPAASSTLATDTTDDVKFKPLPIPPPRVLPAAASEPEPVEVTTQSVSTRPVDPPVAPPVVQQVTPPVAPQIVRAPDAPLAPTGPRTTLADFRKTNPLPAAKPTAKPATTAPAAAHATNSRRPIDVNEILASNGTGSATTSTTSSGSAGEGGERDSFLARLSQKLREAHRKPEGMDDGLRASVAFVLHESGTISDVRIAKTSGDEEFDASAVAAFKRVTALGRPPASLLGANVIVFRTTAD